MIKLIGLTGNSLNSKGERIGSVGVGKDEVGKILSRRYPSYVPVSFAGPVYNTVKAAFNVPDEVLHTNDREIKENFIIEPWGLTLRQMLQLVGSELFRDNVRPDFWVERLKMQLNGLEYAVVTDVRKENEAEFIRSRGGTIVHVYRTLPDNIGKAKNPDHDTEKRIEVKPEDLHLHNEGSKSDLYHQVIELLIAPYLNRA